MLPLGFGWSLWVHLFVQYPKSLGALLLGLLLGSVPVERTGLADGDESVGRRILCALTDEAPPLAAALRPVCRP